MTGSQEPDPKTAEEILRAYVDELGEAELDPEELCARHPEHAEELRRMVVEWQGFLRALEPTMSDTLAGPIDADDAPERIGPYRILEVLGEGGMGTVYLAEQKEPVRRRVALKVIKLGMDSKQVLARFEAERQALAMMNHDNIARVFEAGTTERGQPYFVMEHVEGIPITSYCDQHKLTIKERIDLFQRACAGVQHAHQKGVIHRDLKPSNVLVTRREDRAVPKIIDFGLARATDHQLVEQTLFTEQGQILGTPEYMSPEQAGFDAQGIDTRTDIYSLGVMLYELLSGELPFSAKELRQAGIMELQRKIREDQPPRLSTRISTLGEAASDGASRRRITTQAWTKELRGDLDWIVLKAIAKEPERRYESATGLAADLGRYLEHEPVLAGPPSAAYRVRKFVQRYRVQVAAGVAVLLTLVAGAVGTTWFALVANARAEDNAKLATAEAAARAEAERQQKMAEEKAAAEATARKTIESNSYVANVEMAAAWLDLREPDRVRERLDSCPQQRRGWEWFWLEANADNSLAELKLHTDSVVTASFSPDGTRIVTVSGTWTWEDGVTGAAGAVWDTATGARIAELEGHRLGVISARFSPDGTRIVTESFDKTARVWDAATGASVAKLEGHKREVISASFSPDGTRIVTASFDKTAQVWDAVTGATVAEFEDRYSSGPGPFSPVGTRIVTESSNNTARVWDAATGATVTELKGHTDEVVSASFSPDGTRIVTTSTDNTARVWDAMTGASVAVLEGHTMVVNTARFSPDSKRIVTASKDKTARVWDAATGATVAELKGHTDEVWSASFGPDGTRIVTTSTDNSARVWDAMPYRVVFAERQLRGQKKPWAHLRTQFGREMRAEVPHTWLTDRSLSEARPTFIK